MAKKVTNQMIRKISPFEMKTTLNQNKVAESNDEKQPTIPRKRKAIVFHKIEDLHQILAGQKVYPVVHKRGQKFLLMDAFDSLNRAKAFIRGTKYFIWYLQDDDLNQDQNRN